jgi:hypothetical protein
MEMGMGFAGRGMRMIVDIEWCQNMGMDCARGGGNQKGRNKEWELQNREWWQNTEWAEHRMVAEQGMTDYYCSLNK